MWQLGVYSYVTCLLTRILVSLLRFYAFAFRRSFPAGVGHHLRRKESPGPDLGGHCIWCLWHKVNVGQLMAQLAASHRSILSGAQALWYSALSWVVSLALGHSGARPIRLSCACSLGPV